TTRTLYWRSSIAVTDTTWMPGASANVGGPAAGDARTAATGATNAAIAAPTRIRRPDADIWGSMAHGRPGPGFRKRPPRRPARARRRGRNAAHRRPGRPDGQRPGDRGRRGTP